MDTSAVNRDLAKVVQQAVVRLNRTSAKIFRYRFPLIQMESVGEVLKKNFETIIRTEESAFERNCNKL